MTWSVSKLKNISKSVSKQIIDKTSPNYLQYKIHKRWLLSWIHFIVMIRVITFECFKMQMVINLAPLSLSNKKVNFYTCPRLTFLKKKKKKKKKKCHGKYLQEHLWAPRFQNFLEGVGACPHTPLAAPAFGARNLPRLVLKSGYGPGIWSNTSNTRRRVSSAF